jgi:hypothetical protein
MPPLRSAPPCRRPAGEELRHAYPAGRRHRRHRPPNRPRPGRRRPPGGRPGPHPGPAPRRRGPGRRRPGPHGRRQGRVSGRFRGDRAHADRHPRPGRPQAPGPRHGPDQPAAHGRHGQPARRRRRGPGHRPGVAYAYDPAGSPVKDEDAPLWRNPPPQFAPVVAAVGNMERRVTAAGGLVLRLGHLYGPDSSFDPDGGGLTRRPAGHSTSSTTSPPWSTTGCPRWRPGSALPPPGTSPPGWPASSSAAGRGLHDRPGRRRQHPRPPPAGLEAHLHQLASRPHRRPRHPSSPMKTGTLRRRLNDVDCQPRWQDRGRIPRTG